VYLMGALELRQGPPTTAGINLASLTDMLQHTATERFLERMAASVDGPKAADMKMKVNIVFSDQNESYVLRIEDGVMHHHKAPPAGDANATLTLTKAFWLKMMTGQVGATDLLTSDQTKIDGSKIDLGRFLALLEKSPGIFPIVTR
jgi:alkyl sulfatase BDS1-like metallo-beta-lactamase superfamily hydrolase